MAMLTQIEKGTFLKLFNRNGYILDFSTNDFDVFTLECVGVALCEKYQLSKGKSLMAFIQEYPEVEIVKLFKALLEHYELHYSYEIENDEEYSKLYRRCKDIINRVLLNTVPHAPAAEALKEKFSSMYLSAQIDLMLDMQSTNPTEAIGKAKELVESCCKTILDAQSVVWDKNWDVGQLTGETLKLLKLMPKDIPETAVAATEMKALLGNLRAIATNLAALRNPYGSGHGKSANYKGLEERHAKLAVGCSITLVNFLWDTYEKRLIV
ncbi:abortive infection family protein [uncultured Oscillibacter sp.]|uniref:abortive infection family protein n=1 Tax=uncultured Oscillibacter sp. TaxID=876091 RepID=UPI0025DC59D2|nr:abortive infection family protein [uncultured Oscillibacter sp.]